MAKMRRIRKEQRQTERKKVKRGFSERQRGMKRQKKKKRKGTCFSRQEYFCHIVSIRHRNINLAFSSLSEGGKNKTRQKQIHAAKQKKYKGDKVREVKKNKKGKKGKKVKKIVYILLKIFN